MKEDYKLTKTEKAIVDLGDLQIVGKPFKDYMFDQYIKMALALLVLFGYGGFLLWLVYTGRL